MIIYNSKVCWKGGIGTQQGRDQWDYHCIYDQWWCTMMIHIWARPPGAAGDPHTHRTACWAIPGTILNLHLHNMLTLMFSLVHHIIAMYAEKGALIGTQQGRDQPHYHCMHGQWWCTMMIHIWAAGRWAIPTPTVRPAGPSRAQFSIYTFITC